MLLDVLDRLGQVGWRNDGVTTKNRTLCKVQVRLNVAKVVLLGVSVGGLTDGHGYVLVGGVHLHWSGHVDHDFVDAGDFDLFQKALYHHFLVKQVWVVLHDGHNRLGLRHPLGLREDEDGMYATFKISNTTRGNDALIEASEQLRSGLSVGVEVIDGRKEFVAYSLQPFICAIEDRLSMDDITPRGHVVKFAIEESFLRADTLKRLEAIEKMLSLGLIDVEQAKEMENMTPNGNEDTDVTYVQ